MSTRLDMESFLIANNLNTEIWNTERWTRSYSNSICSLLTGVKNYCCYTMYYIYVPCIRVTHFWSKTNMEDVMITKTTKTLRRKL